MGLVGLSSTRWQWRAAVVAVVPTLVWWIERLVAIPSSGWFSGQTTFAIGGDFRTFHTAAVLAVDGRADVLYDPDVFLRVLGPDVATYGPLGNPPPLIAALAPLGWFSFETAWVIWAVVSTMGIALALRLVGVRRWVLIGLASILFPPVYYTLAFGQLGAIWILVFAGAYSLLKRKAQIPAGLLVGLLVMKPTLAVGFALWWLVYWRRYWRAAVSAFGSAVGLLALSYAAFPEMWTGYVESLAVFVDLRDSVETQWAQFSLWAWWDLLLPEVRSVATVLGLVSSAAFVACGVWMFRHAVTLEQRLSIAIFVTVLVPPHLLAYDWILLLVPGVLLLRRDSRYVFTASAVVLATAVSILITNYLLDTAGFAVQIAPLVLLAAIAVERSSLRADDSVQVMDGVTSDSG